MYRYPTNLTLDLTEDGQRLGEIGPQPLLALPESAPKTTVFYAVDADDYAGDATTTGVLPEGGVSITGAIEVASDSDWFAVTVEAGETWRFNLDADPATYFHTDLCVVTADGTVLAHGIYHTSYDAAQIDYTFDTSGTYYLAAGAYGNHGTGRYSLRGTVLEDDFSADVDTTGSINVNSTVSGSINYSGDVDWFAVTLAADQVVRFRTDDNVNLALMDGQGQFAFFGDNELTAQIQSSGEYFLKVRSYDGPTDYTIGAFLIADDFTASVTTTGTLSVGGSTTGRIDFISDHDWLAIQLDAGTAIEFVATGRGEIAALRDASGNEMDFTYFRGDALGGTINIAQSGTYFLDITGDTEGQFTVSADIIADDYSNDIYTTGFLPSDGTITTGVLERFSDIDWFAVTVGAGETWKFDLNNQTTSYVSFDFALYAADGSLLANGYYSDDVADRFIAYNFNEAGTFYVAVEAYNPVSYTIAANEILGDVSGDVNTRGAVLMCP